MALVPQTLETTTPQTIVSNCWKQHSSPRVGIPSTIAYARYIRKPPKNYNTNKSVTSVAHQGYLPTYVAATDRDGTTTRVDITPSVYSIYVDRWSERLIDTVWPLYGPTCSRFGEKKYKQAYPLPTHTYVPATPQPHSLFPTVRNNNSPNNCF